MTEVNSLDTLELALNSEKREMEFFLKHAQKIKNPLGKAMMHDIAEKGRENYLRLKSLCEMRPNKRVADKTAGRDDKSVYVDLGDMDYEEKISRDMNAALADYDDFKIIEVATRLVGKAANFFARVGEAHADPKEKEFLLTLAHAERENFLNLKDIEEYLKDPVSWFAEMEHHGLDGA